MKIKGDIAELRELLWQRLKGGPGSGHHGHSGRPGQRGGSLPGGAGSGSVSAASIPYVKVEGTGRRGGLKPGTYESIQEVAGSRKKAKRIADDMGGKDAGYWVTKVNGKYHIIRVGGDPAAKPPPVPKPKAKPKPPPKPEVANDLYHDIRPNIVATPVISSKITPATKEDIAKVSSALSALPIAHQSLVKSTIVVGGNKIRVEDGKNKDTRAAFRSSGFSRMVVDGCMYHPAQEVYIAAKKSSDRLDMVVAHEVGHAVLPPAYYTHYHKSGDSKFDVKRKAAYSKLVGNYKGMKSRKLEGKFVTNYAKTSEVEYVAEVYGHYIAKPAWLGRADPSAYAILKEFFDGQEY